jgi:hypothetical protein
MKESTKAFEAAYAAFQGAGVYAAVLAMLTTAPLPRASMAGRNRAVISATAPAFRSTVARIRPGSVVATVPTWATAASLIRRSISIPVSARCFARSAGASGRDRSSGTVRASIPWAARRRRAVSSRRVASRATRIRLVPWAASRSAMAAPMPVPAPVIKPWFVMPKTLNFHVDVNVKPRTSQVTDVKPKTTG